MRALTAGARLDWRRDKFYVMEVKDEVGEVTRDGTGVLRGLVVKV